MTDEPRMTAEDAYQALLGMDEFTTEQAVAALQDREEEIRDRAQLTGVSFPAGEAGAFAAGGDAARRLKTATPSWRARLSTRCSTAPPGAGS